MTNDASVGRHTAIQVQRLERNLRRLSGGEFVMPDHNRYGKDLLFIDQLKAVNICLENILGGAASSEDDVTEEPEVTEPVKEQPTEPVTVEDEEPEAETDVETTNAYPDMNVPQLKSLAKKRGLPLADLHTKVLLIQALEHADKTAEQASG